MRVDRLTVNLGVNLAAWAEGRALSLGVARALAGPGEAPVGE